MICPSCRAQTEPGAQFCRQCGSKISTPSISAGGAVRLYSPDWNRSLHFTAGTPEHFDVMVTGSDLYLIGFPRSSAASWGFALGGLIGQSIAQSHEKKKRRELRATWLTPEQQLISSDYQNYVALHIP